MIFQIGHINMVLVREINKTLKNYPYLQEMIKLMILVKKLKSYCKTKLSNLDVN